MGWGGGGGGVFVHRKGGGEGSTNNNRAGLAKLKLDSVLKLLQTKLNPTREGVLY